MKDVDWQAAEAEIGEKGQHVQQMLGAWLSAHDNMLASASIKSYPPRVSLAVAARAVRGNRHEVIEPLDSIPVRAATMSPKEMEEAGQLAADIASILGLRVFREPDGRDICRYTLKPVYHEKG